MGKHSRHFGSHCFHFKYYNGSAWLKTQLICLVELFLKERKPFPFAVNKVDKPTIKIPPKVESTSYCNSTFIRLIWNEIRPVHNLSSHEYLFSCWYVKEGYSTAVAHSLDSIFYLTSAIFLNPGVSQRARVNVFHFTIASSVGFISTSELSAWTIYICVHAFFLLQFVMLTHTVS